VVGRGRKASPSESSSQMRLLMPRLPAGALPFARKMGSRSLCAGPAVLDRAVPKSRRVGPRARVLRRSDGRKGSLTSML